MSRTLNALFTKLTWQLNQLSQPLRSIEKQRDELEQQIDLNQQKIFTSNTIPASIMPEKEIARSHFMVKLEHDQHQLRLNKSTLQSEHDELTQQQKRLNTELKRLEKHQEDLLKKQQQAFWLKEQNRSDEWVLQQKVPHEN